MGLLDDAIREHLELKRRRGADPGLVAHEEQEAFGPARGGGPPAADDRDAASAELAVEDALPRGNDLSDAPGSAHAGGFSNVGQETAELDMRTVLDEEPGESAAPVGPVAVGPIGKDPRAGTADASVDPAEESLEWEVPGGGGSNDEAADHQGGRETGAGDPHTGSAEMSDQVDEPVEDVLEETPDFLRDTPEQDRLWFEQRPPRDFDFDK
ncbi:MAG TPA: hypothetical protein VES65_11530 [Solirubrobacteraceae bacterium]|nr:hypothetical protein [Solirubrobacteraceae bacterium]